MPMTAWVCPLWRTVSIRMPPSLCMPITRSLGHLICAGQDRAASACRQASAVTRASAPSSACWRSNVQPMLNIRHSPVSFSHVLPCRPRPAVCLWAMTARVWMGQPERAASSSTVLVDSVSARICVWKRGCAQFSGSMAMGLARCHSPSFCRSRLRSRCGVCCQRALSCMGGMPAAWASSVMWCGLPSASTASKWDSGIMGVRLCIVN